MAPVIAGVAKRILCNKLSELAGKEGKEVYEMRWILAWFCLFSIYIDNRCFSLSLISWCHFKLTAYGMIFTRNRQHEYGLFWQLNGRIENSDGNSFRLKTQMINHEKGGQGEKTRSIPIRSIDQNVYRIVFLSKGEVVFPLCWRIKR